MRDALSAPNGASVNVRAALIEAQRTRARIDLEPMSGSGENRPSLATNVEMVLDTTFLVMRPMVGGVVRMLGRYEHYRMSFMGAEGRLTGETQSLGRTRIPNDAAQALYGYKLRLPEELTVIDRRRGLRKLMGKDLLREAELFVLGRRGPILGLVENLDAGGVSLRCRNAHGHLERGQLAEFRIRLPEPVGTIEETVQVTEIEPVTHRGVLRVRVAFLRRNDAIGDALHTDKRRGGAAGRRSC